MPALAELQALFARGLLDDPDALPAGLFAPGPVPAAAALRVHRNTVFGALAQALALTYPTVAALVGEAFFDGGVAAYAAATPPVEARLAAYGGGFPDFLEAWPPAAGLPCLGDVARFDLAIDRCASAPRLQRLLPLERAVVLSLPVSLVVLELGHPADRIRDAVEAGDDAALAAADLVAPSPCWIAVWRGEGGATARRLGPPAGLFLAELLAGGGADAALARACEAAAVETALLAIQAEVFAAPFAAVLPSPIQDLAP